MKTMVMRSIYLTVLALAFSAICFAVSAAAATYYVDATNGSDANAGTGTGTAWKTLNKVNGTTFQPGDRILFKRGESWTGRLWPKGSGTNGSPIAIDTYGSGSAPLINGNGQESAVYLYNQQYWEIKNLEIKNENGSSSRRMGIYVVNEDGGTLRHIYLIGNNVHDVYGNNVKDGNGSSGIKVRTIAGSVQSKFDDVRIDGNTVGPRVDRTGIDINSDYWCRTDSGCQGAYNWYPSTNVVIENNYVSDVGGDGIVPMATQGAIVQYNTVNGFNMRSGTVNAGIWTWNADDTVIQFNEAFNGNSTADGQGFDIDYGQSRTIVQYNYSHDNDGGFILICQPGGAKNDGGIVRYNISQNDGARLFQLAGPTTNTSVYNNTLYLPPGSSTSPIYAGSWDGYTQSIAFRNNIWYLAGAGAWEGLSGIHSFQFDSNTIYGVHTAGEPADSNKSTANPMLAGPGSGTSRSSVDGYKLLANSPALGTGTPISNNGGRDYWGNAVAASGSPNRGAYNGPGVQGTANEPVHNAGFESGTLSPWTNWNTASVVNHNARSGSYALRLAGGPGSAELVLEVQPNTTYTLTGFAKTSDSSQPVRIGVKNYGGAEMYASISSTTYTEGSVTFTTGSSNTGATIYVYKPSGSADAFGDDLSLTSSLPGNGGFELGSLSPWTNWNTASVVNHNARSGSYALRLAGGPGSAEQVVQLLPNTTYTLSGFAKTASGAQPVRIGVKNYGGAEMYASISSTSYTEGSVTFTTGASSTSATIYVYKPSGTADAFADDITITH
ncbi:carbohydrate binding domain-containing protein [Paenibacillus sp. LHD-117]|uniref:carbohydrate binding domain-containing protein n=1 Tax=Paenibacillus sp. LHD-117 TaxID=3071412 RepID=UPI0027E0D842|nr:carbohydrate binding domain-containing protein [Paenibacillus sp. LHD-117]MDQ6419552.1 carbohydrate binding domain-containing protein [Paenibacillus sp. LHD-117]